MTRTSNNNDILIRTQKYQIKFNQISIKFTHLFSSVSHCIKQVFVAQKMP